MLVADISFFLVFSERISFYSQGTPERGQLDSGRCSSFDIV